MSRLATAQKRLEKAVAKLESAMQKTGSTVDPKTLADLETSREAYAALQQRTAEVSTRLDRTIDRLRLVVGE